MLHRSRFEPFVLKRLPAAALPCKDADSLAEKFASRVEWMREQGIGIDLQWLKCSARQPSRFVDRLANSLG